MPRPTRPRRTALYMPGSNPRVLEKGKTLPADVIVMDLEDAVTPEAKGEAREKIAAAIAGDGYGRRELVIRVNGLDTPWGVDDLAFVAASGADAVLLPKVESADTVRMAARLLEASVAPDSLAIWCMMETPRAMLAAAEIAAAHPRLACLVMGTSDLAKDLHAVHTRDRLPFVTSLGLCLLAARAEGLAILDGVYLDLEDADGFAAVCHQGVELGFDGKTVIHPRQLAAANEAFAPTAAEIVWAERITAAHAEAEAKGEGVLLVDGKLVEALHVVEARRLVEMAALIREMEAAAT